MRVERRHHRQGWLNGKRPCEVWVVTYGDGIHWTGTHREPCTEHPPLTGKFYEKPEAAAAGADCGEADCCTNHERVERLVLAAFQLGRETK